MNFHGAAWRDAAPFADIGPVERLMHRRVPLWLPMLVMLLGMAVAIAFGAIVRAPRGAVGKVALAIAAVPDTLGSLLRIDSGKPYYRGDYQRWPGGLWVNHAQPFTDPGYVVLTAFDEARGRPVLRLIRLADGHTMRDIVPDIAAANARSHFTSALIDLKRDRNARRNLMMHPLLMSDGGVVVHDSGPLARFDACGRLEWIVDGIFNHSVETGPDGNIWAAYRYPRSPMPDVTPTFNDEAIAQVSPTGTVLRLMRIADILDRNQLGYMWRGRPYTDDPFHLNDIQPVFNSGRYWRRGDVLFSLRNMSTLFLYRPSTGRILWWRTGPWAFEHDISILDDHRISVFDNHWRVAAPEGEVDGRNRIAMYDFATDRVGFPWAAAMARYDVRTRAQGRATPMANGDMMVEETERGRLMRLAPDGTLRWRYISADAQQRRLELRWSRYLDPAVDGAAVSASMKARCT